MKWFVAVVAVSVVSSIAIAEDTPWVLSPPTELQVVGIMPGGGIPEGSETAKIQVPENNKEEQRPQYNEDSAKSPTPLDADAHAPGNQNSGQQGQGNVDPHEPSPAWYTTPLTVFLLTVIGIGVSFRYGRRQVYFAERADVRAEQETANAVEASLIDRKKERAYLTADRWRMTNEYKGGPYTLTCDLINTGRTPATLGEYDLHTDVRTDLPPLLDYEQLPKADLRHISLGAGEHRPVQAPDPVRQFARQVVEGFLDLIALSPRRKEELLSAAMASTPMPSGLLDQMLGNDKVTLYVYGCFAYTDTFGEPHKVAFCTRYDPRQDIFIVVNDRKYNYST